ncbi:MAG: DEAD/DEAH box helicase [Proteobacteria bacterium]|nr:DEAD/DEAH box helicase [Pseudomonadota bacterium]
MNNFNEMGLPESIVNSLTRLGLVKPTAIQAQTIPLALTGQDILGSAQTGTGKTLAFTLPLIKHLMENPHATALVLAPIREIAQQVLRALHDITGANFKTALIIGGEPYPKQLSQLKANPRVIIGTPGRIIDHLERGTLRVNNIECLVLDETDRMFDMGFGIQLDHIISKLPTKRQTLMFSATIAPEIEKLAAKYLNDPKRVAVGSSTLPIPKIKQEIVNIAEKEKYKRLLQELEQRDGTVLVFVKTKMNADRLAEALRKEDHSASAIHGDLRQRQREKVIRSFSQGKCRIMVATDIAARGLDIPHLMHVINYDVPPCPEDYIHRIGRTGRAGAEGFALCFVTSADAKKWNAIERYMNPKAHEGANNRNSGSGNGSSRGGFGSGAGRPRSSSPYGDKPRGERSPFGEKRAFGDKPRGERSSFGDKPAFGERRAFGDKPRGERSSFGDKPRGERSSFGDKPAFGERRAFGDKPRGERSSFGDKPTFGDKLGQNVHLAIDLLLATNHVVRDLHSAISQHLVKSVPSVTSLVLVKNVHSVISLHLEATLLQAAHQETVRPVTVLLLVIARLGTVLQTLRLVETLVLEATFQEKEALVN